MGKFDHSQKFMQDFLTMVENVWPAKKTGSSNGFIRSNSPNPDTPVINAVESCPQLLQILNSALEAYVPRITPNFRETRLNPNPHVAA